MKGAMVCLYLTLAVRGLIWADKGMFLSGPKVCQEEVPAGHWVA